MTRKLLAILIALAIPATASAAPNFYMQGLKIEGGEVPALTWGNVNYTDQFDARVGIWTCPSVGAAKLGSTTMRLLQLRSYECVGPPCEAIGGVPRAEAINTPWLGTLVSEGGRPRIKFPSVGVVLACERTANSATATGELNTGWENGSAKGAAPAAWLLGGHPLTVEGVTTPELEVQGKLHLFGYESMEMFWAR